LFTRSSVLVLTSGIAATERIYMKFCTV
jgi:hypothetical protein